MFQKKHLFAILAMLNEKGVCTRMEIYETIANNDRMPDKFAMLEQAGLIKQYRDPNTRAMKLEITPKGKDVTIRLLEVDSIIRGNERHDPI